MSRGGTRQIVVIPAAQRARHGNDGLAELDVDAEWATRRPCAAATMPQLKTTATSSSLSPRAHHQRGGTRRGQPPRTRCECASTTPRRLVPNNRRKVRAGNCHRPCTLAGPNHRRVWHRHMRGESYDIRRPACGSRGTHARTSARIRVACPHDPPTTSSEPYLRRTDERESGER